MLRTLPPPSRTLGNGLDAALGADPDAVLAEAVLGWTRAYVLEYWKHLGPHEPFQALLTAAKSTADATAALAELLNARTGG